MLVEPIDVAVMVAFAVVAYYILFRTSGRPKPFWCFLPFKADYITGNNYHLEMQKDGGWFDERPRE